MTARNTTVVQDMREACKSMIALETTVKRLGAVTVRQQLQIAALNKRVVKLEKAPNNVAPTTPTAHVSSASEDPAESSEYGDVL